ncbi:MAG: hypothetical protein COV34_01970 [Candidatus Zambryskibacteria bacterium CG10_big_fil_rev_8_21_14_0_10_42_12]|uniref:Uncharacterized protein n=1 Tax=Candidatus Zambryskibacteria bacterium CG10_big_fil_rev_8_21_14_0_10_42_12 TaxID=1975115 RepID=A0A2H0QVP7_9BACT|nr:MAG: hypothetical protein COV34_01970 [Candidatus Zambryskibacteria bacterium CG10_big_fil_rev_8_21_14_0_10_42_12]
MSSKKKQRRREVHEEKRRAEKEAELYAQEQREARKSVPTKPYAQPPQGARVSGARASSLSSVAPSAPQFKPSEDQRPSRKS